MPVQTDQAIVLRLSEYSETSQIVSLFTAHAGLLRLIAKGSRRSTRQRHAPGLDLLEYGELGYAPTRGDAQLGTLTEWVQQDAFVGLRRELVRQYGGLYAAELVSALTEPDDPHPDLFAALLTLLRQLAADVPDAGDATGEPVEPGRALVHFQAALLQAIGYAPVLRQCVHCGRPRLRGTPAYFSSTAGGLVCRDCEMHFPEKRRLPAAMLDADPSTRAPAAWFALLDYHLTHVAGRAFRMSARLTPLLTPAARG